MDEIDLQVLLKEEPVSRAKMTITKIKKKKNEKERKRQRSRGKRQSMMTVKKTTVYDNYGRILRQRRLLAMLGAQQL
uniref:Uncharacterized protein n=1 Tax=Romanomermis culicivorax TaxID=13658 RepID=A0A915IPF8_ROMCU